AQARLVTSQNKYTFITVVKLANYIEGQLKHCLEHSTGCYLLIAAVPGDINERLERCLVRRGIRGQLRFMWEPAKNSLIIKLMPGITHEGPTTTFMRAIDVKVASIPGHNTFSLFAV